MKLIFVGGAYYAPTWSGIEDNIRKADAAAIKLVKEGWAVICPHKNSAHWEVYNTFLPLGNNTWYQIDIEILKRCDAIFLLKDWQESKGTVAEFNVAFQQGLAVYYEEDGIPKL